MAKKIAPAELIQQDFHNLKTSERLYTIPRIEDLIFMQSIEGRAHNGAGHFSKRFYVNTTIDEIVSALGRSPKVVKAKRQELIDEIVEFVDSVLADDPRDKLVTRNGRPLLGIPQFKERTVNYHDILKGLYLGGLRDDPDIRKKTQALYGINIGYGKCYQVNTKVMDEMALDGEILAHQEHGERLNYYKSHGLIVEDPKKIKHTTAKYIKYLYIRHHVGPGQSDDAAMVTSGLLYNVDVALGVFLADAIDTFDKYVSIYRDQDKELALYIKERYSFLDVDENDVYELAYLAAIPENRIDEVPDSSLRYLLSVDQEAGLSPFETHLNFIEGKPFLPIAISYKRILVTKLYDFVKDKLCSINKGSGSEDTGFTHTGVGFVRVKGHAAPFITVSPQTSLKSALDKVEARKSDLIIVKDELGNILGVVNPADFLVFLRGRVV